MVDVLRRSLGRVDVVCIGLNAIVGSGIFLLPDDLSRQMGLWSPLAFVLCALGLLPVALCFSEAASSVDRSGGPYVYAAQAFGPAAGFVVGWMCFANAVFSFAAVASAASAYLGRMVSLGSEPWAFKAAALAMIAAFAVLNYRGARPGAVAVNLFTVAKFLVLLLLVGALLPNLSPVQVAPLPAGLSGVGSATFVALFAVQGFEVVPVPAGETRTPEREVPFAILASLLSASLLYVVVQGTLVLGYPHLPLESETPLADAALAVVPALGPVVVAGGLISTLGFVSGTALGTPRYLYALAKDRHLPAGLAAVHPRFASPHRAVIATAVAAGALVVPFSYRSLIGMSNVAVAVQYLATCLAVPVLRRRNPKAGFRAPGGPLTPLVGAAVTLWVMTEASAVELGWAGGSLAVGLALRFLTRTRS